MAMQPSTFSAKVQPWLQRMPDWRLDRRNVLVVEKWTIERSTTMVKLHIASKVGHCNSCRLLVD
jgi:hypothetical protein